jgi:anthranilate/para-aminobenzoate synthase component II
MTLKSFRHTDTPNRLYVAGPGRPEHAIVDTISIIESVVGPASGLGMCMSYGAVHDVTGHF